MGWGTTTVASPEASIGSVVMIPVLWRKDRPRLEARRENYIHDNNNPNSKVFTIEIPSHRVVSVVFRFFSHLEAFHECSPSLSLQIHLSSF
jgi:hypothetical protein